MTIPMIIPTCVSERPSGSMMPWSIFRMSCLPKIQARMPGRQHKLQTIEAIPNARINPPRWGCQFGVVVEGVGENFFEKGLGGGVEGSSCSEWESENCMFSVTRFSVWHCGHLACLPMCSSSIRRIVLQWMQGNWMAMSVFYAFKGESCSDGCSKLFLKIHQMQVRKTEVIANRILFNWACPSWLCFPLKQSHRRCFPVGRHAWNQWRVVTACTFRQRLVLDLLRS